MKDNVVLDALKKQLHDILYWRPDYEEYGMQFGPDLQEALPIIDEILKIDPRYKLPKEFEIRRELIRKWRNLNLHAD